MLKINKVKIETIISTLLASLIIVLSFLTPLDKGFPEIKLFSTFNLPILFVLILLLFTLLFFREKMYKNYIKLFEPNFILTQMLVLIIFAISSIKTGFFHASLVYIIHYFCLFVLDFISFTFLLENKKTKKILIRVAIFSAIIAAFIGIYEFITKSYPSFYRYFIIVTDGVEALTIGTSLLKATGTQGLHIVYSSLMAISVCLSQFIDNKKLKIIYIMIVSAGCLSGVSTIGFIILTILFFGIIFTSLPNMDSKKFKKSLFIIFAILIIATLLIVTVPSLKNVAIRILFGSSESIKDRTVRITWTFEKMSSFAKNNITKFLIGNGLRSSSPDLSKDFPPPIWWPIGTGRVLALDSEYLTVLYETGIMGFLLFFLAWFRLLISNPNKLNSFAWWLILSYVIAFAGLDFLPYSGINTVFVFIIALFSIKNDNIKI